MFNNDDIQRMIEECQSDLTLKAKVLDGMANTSDRLKASDVISAGYYERFDRYDSDVCEQFITAYLKAKGD